jgi:ribosomal protein S18 acetylase RimI-like enzyme
MFFKSKYPAHLHINLLPEYQGKGYGTEMLETLFAALKERGINGVMLLASAENKGAIKFYKRNGFKTLVTAFGGVAMGKKLQ